MRPGTFQPLPSKEPESARSWIETDLEHRLAHARRQVDTLLRRRALRLASNAARLVRRLDVYGPRGLVRAIRLKDARGALLRTGAMLAAGAVLAAVATSIWLAAAGSEVVMAVVVAAVAGVAGAAIAALLTNPSEELRRLSVEREQAETNAVKLERSLSTATGERDNLTKRVTQLEGEKESLEKALTEQQESVRSLEREVAELSEPGYRRWLAAWRRKRAGS